MVKIAATGHTGTIPLNGTSGWLFIGNISIGTPPQTLQVAFDIGDSDLYVFASDATVHVWSSSSEIDEESVGFDSSLSSTFTATNTNFSEWNYVRGKLASDLVNLGDLQVNLTFGDATTLGAYVNNLGVDGFFGLSPHPSYNNVPNVLTQLVPNLEKPIIVWHANVNSSYPYNGRAQVAMGTDNADFCANNWQYVQLVNATSWGTLGFPLTSVSMVDGNGCVNTVKTNHSIVVEPGVFEGFYVSRQVRELFVQASGAIYNTTASTYQVPCDQGASGRNVTLNIGDGSQQLVLTPQDYTVYNSYFGICQLYVYGSYDENNHKYDSYVVYLGQQYLNKMCTSYNIQTQQMGLSDALAGQ